MGLVSPLMRELRETEYQFRDAFVMDSSVAEATFGLKPTPWEDILATSRSILLAGEEAVRTDLGEGLRDGGLVTPVLMPAWNSPNALTSRIGLGSRSDLAMWTNVTWSSSLSVVYRKPSGRVRLSSA